MMYEQTGKALHIEQIPVDTDESNYRSLALDQDIQSSSKTRPIAS